MNKHKLPENFDKVLKQVPKNYYQKGVESNLLQKFWHSRKWEKLKKFLASEDGNLLDIGCADGTTTSQMHDNYPRFNITGVDIYENAVKFAQKSKPQIKFVVADAHKLPFRKNSFDIVTAIETLEHMHKPEQVLLEIRRVLKLNGTLILVQDTDSLLFRLVWALWTKWRGSVWRGSHINCVGPDKLFKMLKRNDFKIINYEYSNLKMEIFIKAQKRD